MKYLTSIFLVYILCACGGSGNSSGKREGSQQDSSENVLPEAGSHLANTDTILWIGKSARWKKTEAEIFDGSYDSTNGLFVPCGKKEPIKVAREFIDFELVNNCDTALEARVRVMLYDRIDSSFNTLPHKLDVTDKDWANQSSVLLNDGKKTIHLKPRDAARVKEVAINRNNLYIRKKMFIESKK